MFLLIVKLLVGLCFLETGIMEYTQETRYSESFYYSISRACPKDGASPNIDYFVRESFASMRPRPDIRVLSIVGSMIYGTETWGLQFYSEKLEVYISKVVHLGVNLTAPNLKVLTVIGTTNVRMNDDHFKFPNLRSYNYLYVRFIGQPMIPTYGSDRIEIIRLHRIESSKITFRFQPAFSSLRILELNFGQMVEVFEVCEFISKLENLERLHITNMREECLPAALTTLAKFNKLKFVRLYENWLKFDGSAICGLFPLSIEFLGVEFSDSVVNMTKFECYTNLKTMELAFNNNNSLTEFYSPAPTFRVFHNLGRNVHSNTDKDLDFTPLQHVKVLSLHAVTHTSTSLPYLPNARILSYTGNGLEFQAHKKLPPLPHLRILDISQNEIKRIPDHTFSRMPKLSVVVMQDTKIVWFGDAAFCNLQWPRVINFGMNYPEGAVFMTTPRDQDKYSNLDCLIQDRRVAVNIGIGSLQCDCQRKDNFLLPQSLMEQYFADSQIECENLNEGKDDNNRVYILQYFSKECEISPGQLASPSYFYPYESLWLCKRAIYPVVFCALWLLWALICWVPAPVLNHFYKRALDKENADSQVYEEPKVMFIICPRHARKWCKRIIVPCIQADLFDDREPQLRPWRYMPGMIGCRLAVDVDQDTTNQNSQGLGSPTTRNLSNSNEFAQPADSLTATPGRGLNFAARQESIKVSVGSYSSASSKLEPKDWQPRGPWCWNTRFSCRLAPPGRHRLNQLMEASNVLIIFPSRSLFTEPACRAQLRLAFHLRRLKQIAAPGILVWPTCQANHKTNVNKGQTDNDTPDYDKYYPVPAFDSLVNDPVDISETAVIKAKVPSQEEAREIMQFMATQSGVCVEWRNHKTVLENLSPFLWGFNKHSQIPPC